MRETPTSVITQSFAPAGSQQPLTQQISIFNSVNTGHMMAVDGSYAANGAHHELMMYGQKWGEALARCFRVQGFEGENGPHLTPIVECFECPISNAMMEDPVATIDGKVYERSFIEQWFWLRRQLQQPLTSPATDLELASPILMPLFELQKTVEAFIRQRPELCGVHLAGKMVEEKKVPQNRPNEKKSLHHQLQEELLDMHQKQQDELLDRHRKQQLSVSEPPMPPVSSPKKTHNKLGSFIRSGGTEHVEVNTESLPDPANSARSTEIIMLHIKQHDTGILGLVFPGSGAKKCGDDSPGHNLSKTSPDWRVSRVRSDGQAYGKIQVDDMLIAVNNVLVNGRPQAEIVSSLHERPLTLMFTRRHGRTPPAEQSCLLSGVHQSQHSHQQSENCAAQCPVHMQSPLYQARQQYQQHRLEQPEHTHDQHSHIQSHSPPQQNQQQQQQQQQEHGLQDNLYRSSGMDVTRTPDLTSAVASSSSSSSCRFTRGGCEPVPQPSTPDRRWQRRSAGSCGALDGGRHTQAPAPKPPMRISQPSDIPPFTRDVWAMELYFNSSNLQSLGLVFPDRECAIGSDSDSGASSWTLCKVQKDGLAAGQVEPGDELIAVNRQLVERMSREDVVATLQQRPISLLFWRVLSETQI